MPRINAQGAIGQVKHFGDRGVDIVRTQRIQVRAVAQRQRSAGVDKARVLGQGLLEQGLGFGPV